MADAEQATVTIRVAKNDQGKQYLETSEGKALYRFILHDEKIDVPYGEDWGSLKDAILLWSPLLDKRVSREGSSDLVKGALSATLAPRRDKAGGTQATYRDYQLYTFEGDEQSKNRERVEGLWEVMALDLPKRDDSGTDLDPPIPKGP